MSPNDVFDRPQEWEPISREEAFSALRPEVVVVYETLLGLPAAAFLTGSDPVPHWRYPRFFRKKPAPRVLAKIPPAMKSSPVQIDRPTP